MGQWQVTGQGGSSPYSLYPAPYYGGQPYTTTGNSNNPVNRFTGGVIFFGSPSALQNTRLFNTTFGLLTLPYTAVRSGFSGTEPQPVSDENVGVMKALSSGKFATMTANKYVLMTFTSQLAGVANTLLNIPANYGQKRGSNLSNPYRNTWLRSQAGGWYYINGKLVNFWFSRDNFKTDAFGTYASPGRITYQVGSNTATTKSYAARND